MRESMVAYGASDKPFWMTETGYEATYGDAAAMATQAHFASEVLGAMVTRPWWEATVFYEAFDVQGQPYHWGFALADPDASVGYLPKPVCLVMANPPDFDAALPPDAEADGAVLDGGETTLSDAGRDATVRADDAGKRGATGAHDAALHLDASTPLAPGSSGCGCRVGECHEPSRPAWAGGVIAVTLAARRRRRR